MTMKKERDSEVVVVTQNEFWVHAIDLLLATVVLERFVLKSIYCSTKYFLIFCLAKPSSQFLIKGTTMQMKNFISRFP